VGRVALRAKGAVMPTDRPPNEPTAEPELERRLLAEDVAALLGVGSVDNFEVLDAHPELQKYPLITASAADTYVAVASAETNPLEHAAEMMENSTPAQFGDRDVVTSTMINDVGAIVSQIVWLQRGRFFNLAHIGPMEEVEAIAARAMERVRSL